MLKKIRKSAHSYVFKILFVLLAFIFAIGLGDFSRNNASTVATVGNNKIFLSDFLQSRQQTNGNLSDTTKSQKELINYSVMMKLITQNLIKQEYEKMGIKIAPEIIVKYIEEDSNFYNNGIFDLENYKKTLEYNNISEDKLLSIVSNQIASRFLLDSLIVNLPLKATLSDYLTNYLSEKRTISLLTVDMSRKNIKHFSEQNLDNYYQNNKNSFKTKELRSFSYLLIDPQYIKKEFKISEDELLKEYEENKEEYSLAETRDFYHFLAPSQEIANQISKEIKSGTSPETVAKNFIGKKVIAETFSNQPAQSFLSSLDLSLFNLGENDSTPPIKSELGWHVFKILKINHKQYKSFDEAKNELRENLLYKLAEIEMNDLVKTVEDDIASGANFKDIAQTNNIQAGEVEEISLDEKDSISNINSAILSLAFNTPEMEESEVTMLDPSGYAVVKVTKIFPERTQNFEEAREQAKTRYLSQLKDEITLEISTKLSENFNSIILEKNNKYQLDNKLVQELLKPIYNKYEIDFIDEAVITLKTEELVRPSIGTNNLPEDFVNKLFQLELKKPSLPEKIDNAKYAIASVENITSNKLDQNIYGQIGNISEVNYKNEIYDQYMNYLKKKYNVRIYFDIINSYDSQ
ncbi:MAG: SurA N-terminal domain-containing protein [Rickettsiales bacterium]|jgi:peptidyl-prolyl cis-trans isomerase D|nr:SurA N-terminal domain-containing protein [Rickettsiales bacterium]